ncbi:HEXXH motif domain-containing protein [Streptomyces cadmiisoli]|uniref:HEXXH motif domain-containing protein n=1 Tax=Streptomyces cadmiisoli TaxID=2184053 RepID=A0A2Z4J3A7_9ACTN|nr:HEXXH motif domain-containing protein [Streptomyces cadmiisoli]AWW38913.1 HEXXH motif domain-containing protein [Streptomyces cadmiisoli]
MNAEPSLPRHHLPPESVAELVRGEGGPATLGLLLDGERSRRLLLLRMLDDATELGPAWDLLSAAQRRAPRVVDDLLMYPQTGMWLTTALRRLRGTLPQDDPPLSVVLGHISALAATAALRAELDFAIDVPVRHGRVPLPTLGCAMVPATEPWSTATVRAAGGRAVVEAPGASIAVPLPLGSPGPGWHPMRRLAVGPADQRLDVALDDVDPYRTYPQPTEPRPLSDEAAAQWRRMLEEAWQLLLREQPETAGAMRRGVLSLTPTPAGERFRPRSVSAGDAFGGIEASEPDDAVQLAATLVHEFQHTKLGGLLHLTPLLAPGAHEDGKVLWYAPWRDDPRPLEGLLQGIYAFMGITGFWRARRWSAGADSAVAHFEFALWRAQVGVAMNQVHRHPRFTQHGTALLDTLRERCAKWLQEQVPEEQTALARLCADDHVARWRAHHLRPPAPAVDEAARAWSAGASEPPASLTAAPAVVPNPYARWLDSLAMLVRHRLSDANEDRPWSDEPEKAATRVNGALPADSLLIAGDALTACDAYVAHLTVEPNRADTWAGLGRALALTGIEPTAARLLCETPERARAVHAAVSRAVGRAPDPIHLAAWLGSSSPA